MNSNKAREHEEGDDEDGDFVQNEEEGEDDEDEELDDEGDRIILQMPGPGGRYQPVDEELSSLFALACEKGNLKEVKKLWAGNPQGSIDINYYPDHGNNYGTPLGYAVAFCERAGSEELVKFLLDNGASVFPQISISPLSFLASKQITSGSVEHKVWLLLLDRISPKII